MTNQREAYLQLTRINECLAIINQKLETVESNGKLILNIVKNINNKNNKNNKIGGNNYE